MSSSMIYSTKRQFCLQSGILTVLLVASLTTITPVHPAQNEENDDNMWEDEEDKDPLMDALGEGSEIWEDKCLKIGGEKALDKWLDAQEAVIWCVASNFDAINIQDEIESAKETGDLDLVFKKYCGVPVQKTRPCIADFLEVSRHCLRSKDRAGLNVTMKMIDAAINFVCHNSGDRMALFMAEKGMECLTSKKEAVLSCVNTSVPELFQTVQNNLQSTYPGARRRSVDPIIAFNQENCRRGDQLRHCVEQELLQCDDPTPSNVINAMFIAMWNSTPCKKIFGPITGKPSKWNNKSSLNASNRLWSFTWLKFIALSLHLLLPSTGLFSSISNEHLRVLGV